MNEPTPAAKPHLLVVDDNPSILKNAEFWFRDKYTLSTSSTGEDVLDILKREKIDLVVLDLNLGKLSGQTVLETIKSNYPDLKVIMFTGEILEDFFVRGLLSMGALKCLNKDFPELEKAIEEALKNEDVANPSRPSPNQ